MEVVRQLERIRSWTATIGWDSHESTGCGFWSAVRLNHKRYATSLFARSIGWALPATAVGAGTVALGACGREDWPGGHELLADQINLQVEPFERARTE